MNAKRKIFGILMVSTMLVVGCGKHKIAEPTPAPPKPVVTSKEAPTAPVQTVSDGEQGTEISFASTDKDSKPEDIKIEYIVVEEKDKVEDLTKLAWDKPTGSVKVGEKANIANQETEKKYVVYARAVDESGNKSEVVTFEIVVKAKGAPSGSIDLGGTSALDPFAKNPAIKINDILPIISKAKFADKKEYADEKVLTVVATLKDGKFTLSSVAGDEKALTTSYGKYTGAEGKITPVATTDAVTLTVGDKKFDMVDATESNILTPKDAKDVQIVGNTVVLEAGTDKFEGKLPLIMIENKDQATKWVLDPSKENLADPIKIDTAKSTNGDCVAFNTFTDEESKKLSGLKSVRLAGFVDFANAQIKFSDLKKDEIAKLPTDVEIPLKLVCGITQGSEEKVFNALLVSQTAITLMVKGAEKTDTK